MIQTNLTNQSNSSLSNRRTVVPPPCSLVTSSLNGVDSRKGCAATSRSQGKGLGVPARCCFPLLLSPPPPLLVLLLDQRCWLRPRCTPLVKLPPSPLPLPPPRLPGHQLALPLAALAAAALAAASLMRAACSSAWRRSSGVSSTSDCALCCRQEREERQEELESQERQEGQEWQEGQEQTEGVVKL